MQKSRGSLVMGTGMGWRVDTIRGRWRRRGWGLEREKGPEFEPDMDDSI